MLDGEPRSIAWHGRGKPGCNPRATKSLHFPSRLHAFIPESPIEAQKAGVGNMTHATTINLCYYTLLVDVTKQSPGVSRLSARQAPTGSQVPALPARQGKPWEQPRCRAAAFPTPSPGFGRGRAGGTFEGTEPRASTSPRAAGSPGRSCVPACGRGAEEAGREGGPSPE